MPVGKPGRDGISLVLSMLAALALLGALITGYASAALFDSDHFADRAAASLENPAVQDEIANRITDDLVLKSERDLIGFRPLIEGVVSGIVGGGAFESLFRDAVSDLHRTVFEQDRDTLTLTLADIGATVRGVLEAVKPGVAKKIPGGKSSDVLDGDLPQPVVDAVQVAQSVRHLAVVLLIAALLLVAAAVGAAADRRRAIFRLGIAMAIAGALGVVAYRLGRTAVLDPIDDAGPRDAAAAIWDAFAGDLFTALVLFAAAGAVIAAAAASLLRPVAIDEPLRRVWQAIVTVPETRGLRALRAVLLLGFGIALIAARDVMLDLALIALGLYVAHAGVAELIQLTVRAPGAEPAAAGPLPPARALAVAAIAATVIIIASGLFIGLGGISEPEAAAEARGCNGEPALCDRPLDQVTLPATHNAMSAATNPGWLFAQQEAGIPDQLADGIRGLLIDTHYGQKTEDGTVKTDLSDIQSSERRAYAKEVGTEALDAALRIRDRIVDSPTVGERGIYLCHRFCELGALELDATLREIRNFVASHPDQVLVIVNEDYVSPGDFAGAVERSGLLDYVYKDPVGPPWPTLREMIDSGGRVLMLAENDAGGSSIPWYHEAYDELLQETPYSFKTPKELIGHGATRPSCEPNRGPSDASLFLINHWVDTSPAPRPSNAEKVNARKPLLHRVRACERIRELVANLVAVDFYRTGDLFEVVDALNDEDQSEGP